MFDNFCPDIKLGSSAVQPMDTEDVLNSELPEKMRFVRESERKVSPDFYECMQSLCGAGFSINESMKAFVIVFNKFYKNQFKMPGNDDSANVDRYTLPTRQTTTKNMSLGEIKRLDMIA